MGNTKGTKHKSHKKSLHKKTYQNMLNLKDLFKNRTSPEKGVLRDEICSVYYGIPIKRVLKWDKLEMHYKFKQIKRIMKYLMMKDNFPIISTPMPRGTLLVDNEFGRRQLSIQRHVYFRCVNTSQAGNWRDFCDKIADAVHKTGSKPSEIIKEEKVSKKVKGIIQRY